MFMTSDFKMSYSKLREQPVYGRRSKASRLRAYDYHHALHVGRTRSLRLRGVVLEGQHVVVLVVLELVNQFGSGQSVGKLSIMVDLGVVAHVLPLFVPHVVSRSVLVAYILRLDEFHGHVVINQPRRIENDSARIDVGRL